ncbi:MAG: PAS domain-containing protein [Gammaproteobacteria bacterium]
MATDPIILAKEIAEFKQAEEALVEAQGKLAHLLSSSPAVIYSFDAKGEHKSSFISKNITDLLGYEQHEYLEDPNFWKNCVHPEDADRVIEAMPRLWEEGRLTQEYRFLRKDGTYAWVNDDMRMIRDENGEPREIVGSWSDIEERKKAELGLIHAQDRLDHLLSSSPSVIYSFEAKGDFKCTYISRNVKDLLGYEPREYLEIPEFWKNNIHPDDVERVLNSFSRLRETGRLLLEYRFLRKDGTYTWVNDDMRMIRDENGEPREIVGSWSNITSQTQLGEVMVAAQDRLSRLISFAPAVIYSLEATGKFNATFVSENLKDLLGYEQSEYLDDRNFWANNLHPDDKRRALKEFHNVWKNGRFDSEYRFKKKDGHYIWVRDQLQLVKDDNGNPKEIVGAWSDIDQQKHAQEALKIAKEQAETANRTKTQFVAKISHEFRTPLNAVIGITEMLIEDAKDQGNKTLDEPLTRVHRAGKHLLSLINEFLDISKIEAGKIELCIESFNITELINDVTATTKPMLDTNHDSLEVNYMTEKKEMRSDEKRVTQILLNLLSNAAKFTENGSVTLKVKSLDEDNSDYILFDVIDTGVGIPDDKIDTVFDEYSQVKSSKSSKFAGTGLGLDISRKLARIMGGDITVTSKYGEGSIFTAKLPVEVKGDEIQSHKLV